MNYEVIYSNLITSRLNIELDSNEYYEKHHIWPKSLGGIDDRQNLVSLTAREHFIAHKLLVKITEDEDKKKMWNALWYMSCVNKQYIGSREYEKLRKEISKNFTGPNNYMYGRCGSLNHRYGVKLSEETISRIRQSHIGLGHTKETREKLSKSHTGKILSDIHIENIRKASTGRKHTEETKEILSKKKMGNKNPMYGKKHSEEHKKYLAEKSRGRKHTEESKQKMSRNRTGIKHTDESKKKMSESHKGKKQERVECPYCGKIGGVSNMTRWHFENCKHKKEI